jgi:outer membrane receptor protein involved in Fe transport
VFGQGTYKFNDEWSVTAGLRYSMTEKSGFEEPAVDPLLAGRPVRPGTRAFAFDVSTDLDPNTPRAQNSRTLSNHWGRSPDR